MNKDEKVTNWSRKGITKRTTEEKNKRKRLEGKIKKNGRNPSYTRMERIIFKIKLTRNIFARVGKLKKKNLVILNHDIVSCLIRLITLLESSEESLPGVIILTPIRSHHISSLLFQYFCRALMRPSSYVTKAWSYQRWKNIWKK